MYYIERALATGEIQLFEYQLNLNYQSRGRQLYRQISPELDSVTHDESMLRDYEARLVVSGEDEVVVIVRDITDRKLAEIALRLSEEKFAKSFRSSPHSMTISTLKDGRIIEVNDSFMQITGYSRDEVIGWRSHELGIWVHPTDRDKVVQTLQQQGSVRNLECQFRIKSGEIRTTLFSAEIIDINGISCILGSVVDITERIQAQQQLWTAAERDRLLRDIALRIRESLDLQQILNTTVAEVRQFLQADRVYVRHHDPQGRGTVVAESVDSRYPSVLGMIISDHDLNIIRSLLTEGQVRIVNDTHQNETEHLSIMSFYKEYHVRAGMVAPLMLDHQLFGVLAVNQCSKPRQWEPFEVDLMKQLATQVTIAVQQAQLYQQVQDLNAGLEQQVAERTAQLQQKMEELQELNQLKDEFLNAFSHDLRTPVMGISLVINNLLNQPGDTISVSRSILERMVQSSNHQLHLINSLLQAHSSETRGVILNYELIQLSLLLQHITDDLAPLVTRNQATLTNRILPDLPLVNADPVQLRRVFENLITNALHHNPPGVALILDATVESDLIRCTLEDNGVGMTQDVSDRLFERYSRGLNPRHSTGIGLGLYLCRQIITAHGGQIGVHSTPGTGSTFWLTLPLAISR
jgi:PAS domain S-box-containing protein